MSLTSPSPGDLKSTTLKCNLWLYENFEISNISQPLEINLVQNTGYSY